MFYLYFIKVYGNKQIVMEKDEVDELKKFENTGLVLIGFKPMDRLKLHHHIWPALFIYPEEDQITGKNLFVDFCTFFISYGFLAWWELINSQNSFIIIHNTLLGSSCVFTALLQKCSERNVFALCKFTARRNTPPRFVALVPQREVLDSQVQAAPPGTTCHFIAKYYSQY